MKERKGKTILRMPKTKIKQYGRANFNTNCCIKICSTISQLSERENALSEGLKRVRKVCREIKFGNIKCPSMYGCVIVCVIYIGAKICIYMCVSVYIYIYGYK